MNEKAILVLLAEDNSADAELFKIALVEALPSSNLTITTTFDETLKVLEGAAFDVVVLDGLNGPYNENLIREVVKCTDAQVIVITGDDSAETCDKVMAAGAQDIIVKKEFSAKVLRRRLKVVVGRELYLRQRRLDSDNALDERQKRIWENLRRIEAALKSAERYEPK